MADESIAELVRSYPILYDKSLADLKNARKKELAWREIAGQLNLKSGKQMHESNWVCLPNEWFLEWIEAEFGEFYFCFIHVLALECPFLLFVYFNILNWVAVGTRVFPTWLALHMRMSLVWTSLCLCLCLCLCLSHKCEPGFSVSHSALSAENIFGCSFFSWSCWSKIRKITKGTTARKQTKAARREKQVQ